MGKKRLLRVECRDCGFSEVVYPEDDTLALDLYLEHSRKTGHEVDVTPVEEEG